METQHTFRRAREAARALNRTASERIDRLLLALADAVEARRSCWRPMPATAAG